MKKLIAGLVLAVCLFATTAKAQTRVLFGAEAGSSFGNLYAGPSVALESHFVKHFEFDAEDVFAPAEQHIKLGSGWANTVTGGGVLWIGNGVGVNGSVDRSEYHVSISKTGYFTHSGVVLSKVIRGTPTMFTWDYIQQFNNGIDKTGTESAHLKAGEFDMDMRTGCAGIGCFRVKFTFQVGHVLTQSNPICDGTYGITGGNGPNGTCYRTGASSGTFSGRLSYENPRRRGHEHDPL